jgi:adenine-specific DNA-methyltransferase
MAKIDELLAHIPDQELRRQLQGAVAELRQQKKFGLVFEKHLPETALLPSSRVRIGSAVMLRRQPTSTSIFVVTGLKGKDATVADSTGKTRKAKVSDLLVIKPFGEPVYPVVRVREQISRSAGRPTHVVINGENFHALQLLLFGYEGKVDCIYIDPPYNTGARDWKYNNSYVDAKDKYRHSKWLSFMERRLGLAARLLKDDGVLIVTVDEHEVHHLGVLLEDVFPNHLRQMLTIVINPKGTGKYNLARVEEHAFYVIPDTNSSIVKIPLDIPTPVDAVVAETELEDEEEEPEVDDETGEELFAEAAEKLPFPKKDLPLWEKRHARRRGGESSYREQRPNQFYPLYINEKTREVVKVGNAPPLGTGPDLTSVDGLKALWPIDSEGNERCWRYIPPQMQALIDAGRVVLGRYHPEMDTYTVNYWVLKATVKKPKTVWWETAHDAGTHGTSLLAKLLGRRKAFNFPKSLYAERDCLALVVKDRPNAIIVDFFGGSGTTTHATALLNAEDGGNRRCILVTNNEVAEAQARKLNSDGHFFGDPEFEAFGVYESVTIPRLKAAFTGKRPDGTALSFKYLGGRSASEGFDDNLSFVDIDYEDPDDIDVGSEFASVVPALWLSAGGVGAAPTKVSDSDPWFLPSALPFAVLLDEDSFSRFAGEVEQSSDLTHLWLVTDSETAFVRMRERLPRHLEIGMLYRDYLRNFRVNVDIAG